MTSIVGIPAVPQLPSGQYQFLLAVKKSIEQLQSASSLSGTTTTSTAPTDLAAALAGYKSVKSYGAKGAGGADDTTAIQNAFNAGGWLAIPPGEYCISRELKIGNGSASQVSTINDVVVTSGGLGGASNQELGPAGTPGTARLKWIGAAGGTMLSLNGPMTNSLRGLQFDGNGLAAVAIRDNHPVGGVVEDITIRGITTSYVQVRAYENTPNCYVSAGAGRVYRNVKGWEPVAGSNFRGLDVGNDTFAGAGPGLDVARITFIGCEFNRPSGSSNDTLTLRMCDNLTFIRCFLYGPSTTVGNSIAVRPPTGNAYFPEDITFIDCSPVGAYYTDPAWNIWSTAARGRGLVFVGLNDGDNGGQLPTHPGWSGHTYAMVPFGMHGAISRQNSLVTVTGTTSPTTVWSYSVPGYSLNTFRRVVLRASGRYLNNTGGAVNMSLFSGYGGQTLFNGTVSVPTNASYGSWSCEVDIGAYLAATNKQEAIGQWVMYAAGSVGGVAQNIVTNGLIGAHNNGLTVDSTTAQTMTLVHTLGNSGATIETHSVELTLV